ARDAQLVADRAGVVVLRRAGHGARARGVGLLRGQGREARSQVRSAGDDVAAVGDDLAAVSGPSPAGTTSGHPARMRRKPWLPQNVAPAASEAYPPAASSSSSASS